MREAYFIPHPQSNTAKDIRSTVSKVEVLLFQALLREAFHNLCFRNVLYHKKAKRSTV